MLAGVGFTVSLLIGELAFAGTAEADPVVVGVLVGSVLAAVLAAVCCGCATGSTAGSARPRSEDLDGSTGVAPERLPGLGRVGDVTERPSHDDPTIGRLVADASRDISSLLSKEIELAKSELKVSVKAGGLGIGLFAAAGFLAPARRHLRLDRAGVLHPLARARPRRCRSWWCS